MRLTCTKCARKHVSQACILDTESKLGYPDYIWLAIGHLAEAETELIARHPILAADIREHRKALENDPENYDVPYMFLIIRIGEENEERN